MLAAWAGLLLLLAGAALWQFADAWDVRLYCAIHADLSARSVALLVAFTNLGGASVMIPVGLAVTAWLAASGRAPRALWLFTTVATGRLVVELAKILCARPRPDVADRLVSVTSLSFPSSRSAGTMLTCAALCVALRASWRGWVVGGWLTVAIGLSRILLGVHWPSDVLAGWGFGLFWIAVMWRSETWPDRTTKDTFWSVEEPIDPVRKPRHAFFAAALRLWLIAIVGGCGVLASLWWMRMPVGKNEVRRLPAIDARQGVAAGPAGLYAISDYAIARLDRSTGKVLARWQGDPAHFKHVNSCIVRGTLLICAVSNYPEVPMASKVEWFDALTLKHLGTSYLGKGYGSLTWLDWHAGSWWACYANYDGHGGTPGRDHRATRLVRYDRSFAELARFAFPEKILDRLAPRSASGGTWGVDGLLYVTGHNRPELYVLGLPQTGQLLRLVMTLPTPTHGQAIGWDPVLPRVLWSIERSRHLIVGSRIPQIVRIGKTASN